MKIIDEVVRISTREVYEMLKESQPPEHKGGSCFHSTAEVRRFNAADVSDLLRLSPDKGADLERKDESR